MNILNVIKKYFSQFLRKKEVFTEKKLVVDYDYVANLIKSKYFKYVGISEQTGNNDHPVIYELVLSEHGKKGESYCAYLTSHCIYLTCLDLGINYPKSIYRGGSSQSFWHESDDKYKHILKPKLGLCFVHQLIEDKNRGHIGYCTSEIKESFYDTVEGNTDNMIKTRSDRSLNGTTTKKHLGFLDVAQAVLDQYNLKQSLP